MRTTQPRASRHGEARSHKLQVGAPSPRSLRELLCPAFAHPSDADLRRAGNNHHRSLLTPDPRHLKPAFTMIEIMVVIGIIALLLAIAVPTASHLIKKQKENTTHNYMDILKTGIGMFEVKKPLKDKYRSASAYMSLYGDLPPDYFLWEPRPPATPAYEFIDLTADDANNNGMWDPGILPVPPEKITNDQTNQNDEGYHRLNVAILTGDFQNVAPRDGVQRRISGTWQPDPTPNASPVQENYRSIESLYLYMSRLCPECSQQLALLPEKTKANSDVCNNGPCPERVIFGLKQSDPTYADDVNGEKVEITEIRDAWNKPMRYTVVRSGSVVAPKWTWELRSAGEDGAFEVDGSGVPVSDNLSKDDVIERGEK